MHALILLAHLMATFQSYQWLLHSTWKGRDRIDCSARPTVPSEFLPIENNGFSETELRLVVHAESSKNASESGLLQLKLLHHLWC